MIERFTAPQGSNTLIEALRNQTALLGEAGLVEEICDHAEIVGIAPGETIIEESAPSNDIYFILSGIVSIRVHGREIAVRTPGQHVGEMAALDPGNEGLHPLLLRTRSWLPGWMRWRSAGSLHPIRSCGETSHGSLPNDFGRETVTSRL